MATVYALYCVKVQLGWLGVSLSVNLSFLSNDLCNCLLQWCDNVSESTHSEELKQAEKVLEDEFSGECEYSVPVDEPEKVHSSKAYTKPAATTIVTNQKESSTSKVIREEINSADEMRRILNSIDHYEALGFPRHKKIDAIVLKKEYRRKVDSNFYGTRYTGIFFCFGLMFYEEWLNMYFIEFYGSIYAGFLKYKKNISLLTLITYGIVYPNVL